MAAMAPHVARVAALLLFGASLITSGSASSAEAAIESWKVPTPPAAATSWREFGAGAAGRHATRDLASPDAPASSEHLARLGASRTSFGHGTSFRNLRWVLLFFILVGAATVLWWLFKARQMREGTQRDSRSYGMEMSIRMLSTWSAGARGTSQVDPVLEAMPDHGEGMVDDHPHPLTLVIGPRSNCNICGQEGCAYACAAGCDYNVCSMCWTTRHLEMNEVGEAQSRGPPSNMP
eukprot:NODE_17249_length_953_cov_12.981840.p1 GENE.NODE_17249_length_953_cov_12.981840~~NODE_17249_length_953_cov_12.981840.p1  ORF type:complete len:235 (-),score=48.44 NODE_17249_length_953_cov_12.981840:126-830(-)